jgi:hypothetical protein
MYDNVSRHIAGRCLETTLNCRAVMLSPRSKEAAAKGKFRDPVFDWLFLQAACVAILKPVMLNLVSVAHLCDHIWTIQNAVKATTWIFPRFRC